MKACPIDPSDLDIFKQELLENLQLGYWLMEAKHS